MLGVVGYLVNKAGIYLPPGRHLDQQNQGLRPWLRLAGRLLCGPGCRCPPGPCLLQSFGACWMEVGWKFLPWWLLYLLIPSWQGWCRRFGDLGRLSCQGTKPRPCHPNAYVGPYGSRQARQCWWPPSITCK
jgi:hypothetical protein